MNIYDSTGKEILDILVDDSSVRYRSIMSDDSLTLDFSTTGPVSVPRWAYCVYEGARYTLFYTENFKKNNTRDFEYTLTLHGWREWLNFVKFKDVSSKPYRLKFSLTATPREFMSALVACLNLADPMGGWAVGDCIEATEKALSFNHEWCIDVLGRFVSEFNTEYEFESKIVHLRKVEKYKGDPLPLSYGKGNGFKSGVGRSNEGNKQPIGKLFVEGGDRNIDYSTYKSNTLLLPKSATLEYNGKTYRTDADGVYITRDGNNNIGEDSYDGSSHYPKRVGTVSEVIPVDAPKNFYDIKDSSIPASLDYSKCRIGGEKATIVFQSGVLAGREFDLEQTDIALTGYIHSERRFKIVPAELDGYMMPGGAFVPAVGDKYAIFNISMPSAYISDDATKTGASWDMFREAVKYFAEEEQDKFSFTGELDGVWSKSRWLEIGGKIVPGGHVLFSDPQFQPDGVLIRITAVKDYVNSPHKPEITLSNAPVSGSFSADLGKIEAGEVIRESDKKEVIRYSKRQWRDARETMSMLQESLLNYSGSINPITVRTMQLLVGDEGLQFRFVNSKTNPQRINHDVSFNATTKVLTAASGILQHMTLGITTLKKTHAASEYKYWDMSAYASPALEAHKAYYLYAKCSKTGTAGTFLLSETAIAMESVADYYHFLLGILNSEQDDDRSFAPLYGYTEILPGRVTTDKIVSQDGKTYFDLLGGVIGGRIKFQSGGEDKDLGDWAKSADDGIQDAKDKVDDLQTGGVNLYLNSNKKVTNAGYGLTTYSFAPGTELIAGEDYVLSIKGTLTDPSQDGFYINVQINDGSWSALVIVGEADKDVDGVYRKVFKMPSLAGIDTHNISGLYSNPPGTYKQSSVDWIMLQKGNKPSISWQENPADTQARIADAKQAGKDAQDSITETNATVSGLKNFTDTSFRDGIIDRTESAAIEKYKNSLNETMLKAEASYNKVYGNSYLEGSAKTNLLNAKINLWGARDTLLSSINSAIANGETTAAEKADVDSKFSSFNSYMSAYQSALEEANKAIQVKLDSLSTDKANNAKSDAISEANQYTVNQLRRTETVIDAQSLDVNTYYPVLIKMSSAVPYRIKLYRTLSGAADGIPSWSTHTGGFSVNCEWTSIGSGWGTIDVRRIIERFSIRFVNGEAVGSIGQMTNSSYEYIYVRGGSRYHFIVEGGTGVEVSLKTEAFTTYNESVGPISSGIVVPVITTDAINAVAADAQAKANEAKAKTQYQTLIDGGLIYSAIMKLFDAGGTGNETAGISGVVNGDTNNPAFWAGGTYDDAVAGIANIIHRFNGSSKIGVFFVEKDGKIRVIDPGTGETRFLFNNANIPTLSSLLNSSGYGQTVSNAEELDTVTTYELPNKLTVTKEGSEIIFNASYLQIALQGSYGQNGVVVIRLHKDGELYAIGERLSLTLSSSSGTFRRENIMNNFPNLPTGTYSIVVAVSGNATSKFGHIGASTLSWRFAGAKQTQFGLNGFTSFFSNNHIYFTESGGLDVRGKVNMPGVLAAGRASSQGIMQYGWKMSKISNLDVNKNGTGRYTITHNIGHQKYSPIIIQLGQSVFPSVDYIGNYAVECSFWEKDSGNLTDAPFSFTLIGESY
ncbi:MAG TPA: hypothetical protein DEG28_01125 [Porphyromonadaceae bacterium]|nr:hypothetical protein [Porphyromonadaceae bacterium]